MLLLEGERGTRALSFEAQQTLILSSLLCKTTEWDGSHLCTFAGQCLEATRVWMDKPRLKLIQNSWLWVMPLSPDMIPSLLGFQRALMTFLFRKALETMKMDLPLLGSAIRECLFCDYYYFNIVITWCKLLRALWKWVAYKL